MHVNRIIRSAQRAHELVLYDFLYLLYESRAARERKGGTGRPRSRKGKGEPEAAAGYEILPRPEGRPAGPPLRQRPPRRHVGQQHPVPFGLDRRRGGEQGEPDSRRAGEEAGIGAPVELLAHAHIHISNPPTPLPGSWWASIRSSQARAAARKTGSPVA